MALLRTAASGLGPVENMHKRKCIWNRRVDSDTVSKHIMKQFKSSKDSSSRRSPPLGTVRESFPSYDITDDNRRRLEILKAFSVMNGDHPTIQDPVNRSIQDFFTSVYERYCEQCPEHDLIRMAMEKMLPEGE